MIDDIGRFLDWFRGVHRRTIRDVSNLPPDAVGWRPEIPGDEGDAWTVTQLVQHIAEARPYFAGAFAGRGWVWEPWPTTPQDHDAWRAALEESLATLERAVGGAGPDDLARRIELIGAPDRTISAWRALMMMAEHEIHHRSQLVTYASMNGWQVAQIFEAENEWVRAQRDDQIERYRTLTPPDEE